MNQRLWKGRNAVIRLSLFRMGFPVTNRVIARLSSARRSAWPTKHRTLPEVLEVTYAGRTKYSFTDCDEVISGPLDSPNWLAAAGYGLGKFVY